MKRHISLYIIAILLPLVGWAQERRMLSLPNLEQLSSKHILEVMQDSEGFLWYATQGGGVCRDDGRQMMVFRSDAEHPDLLDVLFQPTKEQLENSIPRLLGNARERQEVSRVLASILKRGCCSRNESQGAIQNYRLDSVE